MSSQTHSRYSRRRFLARSTAWTATAAVYGISSARADSPNERVNLAAVGVGGKGWSDIVSCSEGHNVVAFCDVDTKGNRRGGYGQAAERWPNARRYTDWRVMLDREHQQIDGVTVSTPDHMHAPVTMSALQLGLGTYTQKPLSRTVLEARRLTEEAARSSAVTQMGNQGHSGRGYRLLVRLIQDGAIGKIKEAHAWSNRPIWPQGIDRPSGSDPAPDSLHWDLWLGVAADRPFRSGVYHPFKWRGWFDFGAGALGDMGCHILDPVVWALELGPANTVRYEGPEPKPETFPSWEILHYEFPGTKRTAADTVSVKWYDGGRLPPAELARLPKGESLPKNGSLFVGERGALLIQHGRMPRLLPVDQFQDYDIPDAGQDNHYLQWTNALRGAGKPTSSFDYSGPLTETVLLGTIAARAPGETLRWNSKDLKFEGNTRANDFVHAEYRTGWKIKGLS